MDTTNVSRFQPRRRGARLAAGAVGAIIGLGTIVSVVQGLGSRSHGQSLGGFMAQQRAIATNPVAQAEPATTAAGRRGS